MVCRNAVHHYIGCIYQYRFSRKAIECLQKMLPTNVPTERSTRMEVSTQHLNYRLAIVVVTGDGILSAEKQHAYE